MAHGRQEAHEISGAHVEEVASSLVIHPTVFNINIWNVKIDLARRTFAKSFAYPAVRKPERIICCCAQR